MTKLEGVRNALVAAHSVEVLEAIRQNHAPKTVDGLAERVDYIVAPKAGIYTAPELNRLLSTLGGGMTPSWGREFRDWDLSLELGVLAFDEIAGTMTVHSELNIRLHDFVTPGVVFRNHQTFDEVVELVRRTYVWLYPDKKFAAERNTYGSKIPKTVLYQARSARSRIGSVDYLKLVKR